MTQLLVGSSTPRHTIYLPSPSILFLHITAYSCKISFLNDLLARIICRITTMSHNLIAFVAFASLVSLNELFHLHSKLTWQTTEHNLTIRVPQHGHFWELAYGKKFLGFCFSVDNVNQGRYITRRQMEAAYITLLAQLYPAWKVQNEEVARDPKYLERRDCNGMLHPSCTNCLLC